MNSHNYSLISWLDALLLHGLSQGIRVRRGLISITEGAHVEQYGCFCLQEHADVRWRALS